MSGDIETIEARARELSSQIWNAQFTSAAQRWEGLEIWSRVTRYIRRALEDVGGAESTDPRRYAATTEDWQREVELMAAAADDVGEAP